MTGEILAKLKAKQSKARIGHYSYSPFTVEELDATVSALEKSESSKLEMARRIEELEKQVPDYKGHNNLADMVATHAHVWKDLLIRARNRCHDRFDSEYYQHEINALLDIEKAAEAIAHPNQSIADTGLSLPIGEQKNGNV